MLTIRGSLEDESELILRLKTQAGWNQTPADLARFRALAPQGLFLASWSDVPVGCVMVFELGHVAWIAMMLVEEAYRGSGIGRALMSRALEYVDQRQIPTVRLDATPQGQPLYETLGFVPQFSLGRFAGIPTGTAELHDSEATTTGALLPAMSEQYEEMIELDQDVTRTDRRALLLALFQEHPDAVRVVIHDRRILGYVASRPGAHARQIGPCIADIGCGARLLADALVRYSGQPVFLDVPMNNPSATAVAESQGMSVQRRLTRMCRGQAVLEDVDRVFASSSPEKG